MTEESFEQAKARWAEERQGYVARIKELEAEVKSQTVWRENALVGIEDLGGCDDYQCSCLCSALVHGRPL